MLYESTDDGQSWQYLSTPAPDKGFAIFEEPCICEYAPGKLSMLIRTLKGWDGEKITRAQLYSTVSEDGGRTWSTPVDTGIHGEPAAMTALPGGKVLVVYGYRKEPQGVRARICSGTLDDLCAAQEFIIRDDGKQVDCGYPWIAPMGDGIYSIAYYLNPPECDGTGGIWVSTVKIDLT